MAASPLFRAVVSCLSFPLLSEWYFWRGRGVCGRSFQGDSCMAISIPNLQASVLQPLPAQAPCPTPGRTPFPSDHPRHGDLRCAGEVPEDATCPWGWEGTQRGHLSPGAGRCWRGPPVRGDGKVPRVGRYPEGATCPRGWEGTQKGAPALGVGKHREGSTCPGWKGTRKGASAPGWKGTGRWALAPVLA